MNKILFLFLLVALSFNTCEVFAQSSPGSPDYSATHGGSASGIFFGAHLFGGTILGNGPTMKCDCEFDNGKGYAVTGGIDFAYTLTPAVRVLVGAGYAMNHALYEKSSTRSLETENGTSNIDFKRAATVDLSQIAIMVNAQWKPGLQDLYLIIGGSAAIPMNGTLKDEERVVTPGYVYPEQTNQRIFMDGKLADYYTVKTMFAAVAGIGYDFPFGNAKLSPELSYSFPLTPVVTEQSSWKLGSFGAGIRFLMGL